MKIKYIIVESYDGSQQPFLFSKLTSHSDMAGVGGDNIIGAGFCQLNGYNKWTCYGESTSLRIKSRGVLDDEILNRAFDA
jgi:hypothetical protein